MFVTSYQSGFVPLKLKACLTTLRDNELKTLVVMERYSLYLPAVILGNTCWSFVPVFFFFCCSPTFYICTYWSYWECFVQSLGSVPYFPLWKAQWICWVAFAGTSVGETDVDTVQCVQRRGRLKGACVCIRKSHQIHALIQPIRIFSFKMASVHITIRLPHITIQ